MEFTIQSSLITFLFILLLWKLCRSYYNGPKELPVITPKLPPGPWKLPIIGSVHHLVVGSSLPHVALRDLARKYGPLMHLQLCEVSAVVISDAGMAKEVLKTHDVAFANRPKSLSAEVITYKYQDVACAPYGDYWRQMRKICVLELLSAKSVRSFCSIREDEVWDMIGSIQSSSSASTSSPINLDEKIFALTNSVTFRAAFGARCKDQDVLIELITKLMKVAGGFTVADLFPSKKFLHVLSGSLSKVMEVHNGLDSILEDIVQQHRKKLTTCTTDSKNQETGQEEDLVDVLLKISERGDLNFPITTESIKAIIMDMFSAGTETSASIMLWAMSEMIRNQEVLKKAQAEVRQILKGKSRVSEKDLEELSYLNMVIKETLRLHPPIALLLPRECKEEQCEINGYDIPVGTKIIINAWAVHRDPEHWEDAEAFKPERFDKSCIEIIGSNFEFIPFGGGRRICPGISFGMATVVLALAQLLHHFDWELPGGEQPELLDMTEVFGASVKRKNNLCLVASSVIPFE